MFDQITEHRKGFVRQRNELIVLPYLLIGKIEPIAIKGKGWVGWHTGLPLRLTEIPQHSRGLLVICVR